MENDKIILKLNGGLGNQMFQWAFGSMLEEMTDAKLYLDMSYFSNNYARQFQLDIFELKPKVITDFITKLKLAIIWKLRKNISGTSLFGYKIYSEPHLHFDTNISKIKKNTFVEGFFQSESYFKMIKGKIKEDFNFKQLPDEENQKIISKMMGENSLSVHVRRGDYVQKQRYQELFATCSLDYYKNAVDYITQNHPEPVIYIFSDDISWAKKNIRFPYKCIYISHNIGAKSYEDMRLMSMCKHNIIANSSFSWWGAWLNRNPDKIVIAPKKWFNDDTIIQTDIIPNEWVRIEN